MSVYKNGVLVPVVPAIHGAAEHNDVTREIFLPACEGHIYDGSEDYLDVYAVVTGTANATAPDVYFTMKVPVDFVSFTSVKAVWYGGNFPGDMYWIIAAIYCACGEAYDAHSESPAFGATANGGSSFVNCQEPANPLTLVSLAPGDNLGLEFYRQGSNELDTLDASCSLFGLLFTYVASQ